MCYKSRAPKKGALKYRGVEQLVARRAHNPEVAGSSPVPATKAKSLENPLFMRVSGLFLIFSNTL